MSFMYCMKCGLPHDPAGECGRSVVPKFSGISAEPVYYRREEDHPKPKPTPETVLQEAERLINGDRRGTYGPPSESFNRIAGLWSAYLGTELTALDVANLMVLLKVSRTKGSYHRDSYVDIGGYAGLAEQLGSE